METQLFFNSCRTILLRVHSLGVIVLLTKFLVPQEFGIHPPRGNVLGALLLFDAVGMRLLRIVVRARVL
jgi:hypothetical protein